jgi:hypothetical protein
MKATKLLIFLSLLLTVLAMPAFGQPSSVKRPGRLTQRLQLFIEYQHTGRWNKVAGLIGDYYCVGRNKLKYTPEQKRRVIEQLRARPMLSLDMARTVVGAGTDQFSLPPNKQYRWVNAFVKYCDNPNCLYIETRLGAYADRGDWFFTPLDKEFYNLGAAADAPNNGMQRTRRKRFS